MRIDPLDALQLGGKVGVTQATQLMRHVLDPNLPRQRRNVRFPSVPRALAMACTREQSIQLCRVYHTISPG